MSVDVGSLLTAWSSASDHQSLCCTQIYLPCGPIAPPIRLGRDPKQRQAKLLALKEPLLKRARRYQQTRYGNQSAQCNNTDFQLHETQQGDLICTQAAIIRVKASVTRTFERVRFIMCSIEIAISEKTGHTAIREEPGAFATEPDESGVVQSRWVMFLPEDLLLEANTVSFSAFHEADPSSGASEYGIVSTASVEQDELYPYQPLKRAHLEGSSVLTVERDLTDPEMTVVKYLAHRKLHRFDPGLQVAPEIRCELPAMLDRWCDGIQSIMRDDVLMLTRETECRERMEEYCR